MSSDGYYDATNLPEGLLAQQYTMCDSFFHSAFGGSFLNHQFVIAAQAPVYYGTLPASLSNSIAYLDSNGVFVMNTSGTANGKYVRDGSITPVAGDQIDDLDERVLLVAHLVPTTQPMNSTLPV